ncbi:MAG: insulinase family protein [Planctomycetes bacterium]|jgi:zinc protease|nr:insulinase family protein [Planctomycetota bacterium]
MSASMLPDVEVVELDNGFKALLVERGPLPVVASLLWYRVGSRDEHTGETGVSHFLEHMMFKGTEQFAKGQIDLQTSKMGGSNNAFTDNDSTAYYFALAADRWETALEIEASRMRNCLLDPHEFASEKNVVLEELAMGEDDPWRPLYQATETLLYQVHPYHHPVIGYRQDLERLSAQQMRDYYARHYGPNRAFLVIVGNIDRARTAARIRELFGSLPRVAERVEPLKEPPAQGERRAVLRTPHSVTRLCIGFPTCRIGERDDYALDVLAHDLGNSKNSRLYRRLVMKDELVTDVNVMNETRQDPGALFVLCELRDGVKPAVVEAAVREEIAAQIAEGVAKKDLQRIRAQIRASFLFQDESVLDLAMKLGRFEAGTPDGFRTLETVLPTYESLTSDELRAVAAKYLDFERAAVVWAMPGQAAAEGRAAKAKDGKRKARPVAKKAAPVAAVVGTGRKAGKVAAKVKAKVKVGPKAGPERQTKGKSKQRGKRA